MDILEQRNGLGYGSDSPALATAEVPQTPQMLDAVAPAIEMTASQAMEKFSVSFHFSSSILIADFLF